MRKTSLWYVGISAGALVAAAGCTSAERSQLLGYGSNFKVSVYSGEKCVRTFTSSGKVLIEAHSVSWYFTDKETGKLVRVSGTVVIEQD